MSSRLFLAYYSYRDVSNNLITSIASGTFTGLESLTQLYRANCYFSIFMALMAHVKLSRRMDTLATTKAPFNMLAGTPLTQLYAACFAMLHISLIVNLASFDSSFNNSPGKQLFVRMDNFSLVSPDQSAHARTSAESTPGALVIGPRLHR
jgi:hypothetical protein